MKKTNIQKKSEDSSEHGSVYDNKKKYINFADTK